MYPLFVILDEVKINPTWLIYRGSHSITQASASCSSQQQVITDSNQIGWSNCPWTTINPHTVTKSCLVLVFKCISLKCVSDVGGWQPPVAESMRFESCVSFFFCTPWWLYSRWQGFLPCHAHQTCSRAALGFILRALSQSASSLGLVVFQQDGYIVMPLLEELWYNQSWDMLSQEPSTKEEPSYCYKMHEMDEFFIHQKVGDKFSTSWSWGLVVANELYGSQSNYYSSADYRLLHWMYYMYACLLQDILDRSQKDNEQVRTQSPKPV